MLVVEDEPALREGLTDALEHEGYAVEAVRDGDEALKRIRRGDLDLIVLDWMLPGRDGLSICKALRKEGNHIPVLMLTARGGESDRIAGLRTGADDYVVKPFSVAELVQRVAAILRRAGAPERLELDGLTLDLTRRIARRGKQEVELTEREITLIRYLWERRSGIVPRADLLRDVWDYPPDVETRTIDIHIAKLRQKIEEDPASPKWIVSVRGTGYRWGVA